MTKLVNVKKNIIFIDHAEAIGGAEKVLLSLFYHLNDVNIHLVCQEGELAKKAEIMNNVDVHRQHLPRLQHSPRFINSLMRESEQINHLAKSLDAVIIYGNTNRAAFYGKAASVLSKRPFIWHVHDFWLSESKPKFPFIDKGLKQLLSWNTHIIAVSQAVVGHLPSSAKVSVVHNGIEVENFDPKLDSPLFRAKYHIPENVPLVGMMGRLRPWKGQTNFLQMAAHLRKSWPDCHFVIVGGATFGVQDNYRQQLQQLTQSLDLTKQVTFTGALADVRPALAAMDVFVHPGKPEPFGLVNVEAMAMAKPVVAFNHGALPEIVVDGETGLLVEPGNHIALADAVSTLLARPDLVKQLGWNGRNRAETHFTIQRTAHVINKILKDVISE